MRNWIEIAIALGIAVLVGACCCTFVMRTRAEQQRQQCLNNIKQINLSILNCADTWREFPRMTAWGLTHGTRVELPIEKQASWLYDISPYIEARMDPKFRIEPALPIDAEANRYVVDSAFPIFLCPANANRGPYENFTHYVGITGVGSDAAMLPLTNPRCGFFGYDRKLTAADITDGRSTTLACNETATDNGPWAVGGHGTARGIDTEDRPYLGEANQFSSRHVSAWLGQAFVGNVGFADGSVRSLSDSLSPEEFEALATVAGGEAVPSLDP